MQLHVRTWRRSRFLSFTYWGGGALSLVCLVGHDLFLGLPSFFLEVTSSHPPAKPFFSWTEGVFSIGAVGGCSIEAVGGCSIGAVGVFSIAAVGGCSTGAVGGCSIGAVGVRIIGAVGVHNVRVVNGCMYSDYGWAQYRGCRLVQYRSSECIQYKSCVWFNIEPVGGCSMRLLSLYSASST